MNKVETKAQQTSIFPAFLFFKKLLHTQKVEREKKKKGEKKPSEVNGNWKPLMVTTRQTFDFIDEVLILSLHHFRKSACKGDDLLRERCRWNTVFQRGRETQPRPLLSSVKMASVQGTDFLEEGCV